MPSVITGVGSYVPERIIDNASFATQSFYDEQAQKLSTPSDQIAEKLRQITGIEERRYLDSAYVNSDMGFWAAEKAIADAGIDPETIDQIIFAHNFGDIRSNTIQSESVPSLAARVKNKLGILNSSCIAYDLMFGCPGWVQGVIQADAFIKAGVAQRCLIIGSETLSRVIDPFDRDSMIFADGAGACILEFRPESGPNAPGILSSCALSHCESEVNYISMEKSFFPDSDANIRFMKMRGRKVFEYAMRHVPDALLQCLDLAQVHVSQLHMIFLHQANEKMDESIIKSMFKNLGYAEPPVGVMPMNIKKLGNSSVATVPTLLDMVRHNELEGHTLAPGDIILLASVGAGMHINAICYRM